VIDDRKMLKDHSCTFGSSALLFQSQLDCLVILKHRHDNIDVCLSQGLHFISQRILSFWSGNDRKLRSDPARGNNHDLMTSNACPMSSRRSSMASQPAERRMKPSAIWSPPQRARRSAVVVMPPKLVASVRSFDLERKVSAAALSRRMKLRTAP